MKNEKNSHSSEFDLKFSGKILIMDDDQQIIHTLEKMLKHLGFKIDISLDGSEAIKKVFNATENNSPYYCIIMDLTIPGGLNGKDTIKILKKNHPNIKTIVSSGYCNDPILSNYKKYGFDGVLTKPYTLNQLKETLALLK